MKANNISPMDLELLQPGSFWKDADGKEGVILAVTNKNVPKAHRAEYPFSVVFTSDFETFYTIKASTFVGRMKHVEQNEDASGYIKSMLLALRAIREVQDPIVVQAENTADYELTEPTSILAQPTLQETPVQILFDENVITEQQAEQLNKSIVSFIDDVSTSTITLTFAGSLNQSLLSDAVSNIIHIDTEHQLYSKETLSPIGISSSYINNGNGFQTFYQVYIAFTGDVEEGDDSLTAEEVEAAWNRAEGSGIAASDVQTAQLQSLAPTAPATNQTPQT